MKLILLLIMSFTVSVSAHDAKEIYEVLNVKENHLNPGIAGAYRIEKSVGGLSCTKALLIIENSMPTYECDLDVDNVIAKDIYDALDVKVIDYQPGLVNAILEGKDVGGLFCFKTEVIDQDEAPYYTCALEIL